MPGGLGRVPRFDDRSLAFPARALLTPGRALADADWECGAFLDQGSEGACVGFYNAHEIIAAPVEASVDTAYAFRLYEAFKRNDEYEGEDYDGTSMTAGANVMLGLGWFEEFRWAWDADAALASASELGPVGLGINWYTGMDRVDDRGFVSVSGTVRGGHAILLRGVSLAREAVRLHNSWGRSWGDGGECWLGFDGLDRLLREDGECVVPVRRAWPEPVPEPDDYVPGGDPVPPGPAPYEPPGCVPAWLARRLARWLS